MRRIFSSEKWKSFLVGWSAEHCEKSNLRIVNAIRFGSHQHVDREEDLYVGQVRTHGRSKITIEHKLLYPVMKSSRHFSPSNYSQLALTNNPTPIIFKCRFTDIWSPLSLYTRDYFCAIVRSIQEITARWPWKWQNKQQAASGALFKHNCLTDDACSATHRLHRKCPRTLFFIICFPYWEIQFAFLSSPNNPTINHICP